jgi:hypothetical protein
MKKPILLFILAAFVCCSFFTAAAPVSKNDVAEKTYKAYYYFQSGEEIIKVSEADIPEADVTVDSEGKLTGADKNVLKTKLNYKKEKKIDGKKVDNVIFVLTDAATDEEMPSGQGNKSDLNETALSMTEAAIRMCYGYTYQSLRLLTPSCAEGNSGACIVAHSSGLTYIVYCSGAN